MLSYASIPPLGCIVVIDKGEVQMLRLFLSLIPNSGSLNWGYEPSVNEPRILESEINSYMPFGTVAVTVQHIPEIATKSLSFAYIKSHTHYDPSRTHMRDLFSLTSSADLRGKFLAAQIAKRPAGEFRLGKTKLWASSISGPGSHAY